MCSIIRNVENFKIKTRSNKEKMKKICINSKLFEILRFVTKISYEIRRQ